ncbi:MAG: hypothetical protein ACK4OM_06960 [Alphaproteobacteria bacterium]
MQVGAIGGGGAISFASVSANSISTQAGAYAGGSDSSVSEVRNQALLFSATQDLLATLALSSGDNEKKDDSGLKLALEIYAVSAALQSMMSSGALSGGPAFDGGSGGGAAGAVGGVGGISA